MLEIELEAVGIRLNCNKPDVVFRQKVHRTAILNRNMGLLTGA